MPKVKNDKPTLKEHAFAQELIKNGGKKTQAALAVYDTNDPKSASVIASQNLDKLRVQNDLIAMMDKKGSGLTDKALLKVHKEGLGAFKSRPIIVGRDSNGHPVYEYVNEEDHATRHKFLTTAYKLKGRLTNASETKSLQVAFIVNK